MEIAPFMNQYFLIAQILNLISYSQSNFFFLRVLLLGAAFFYIMYGATQDVVLIDFVLFNALFFLINIWRAINLYVKIIPPDLSSEEEEIYFSYFHKYMNKSEMKLLFSIA